MSVGIGQEAFVAVNAQTRKSDIAVKEMSLNRRRCLSHDEDFDLLPDEEKKEYEPKYFSHYTMQGCVMECRAEYSFDTCGCLPYYYPEFKNGNITVNGTMCNVEQLECLSNISASFYALGI